MMKLLFRFLITLYIFMSGGQPQLQAATHADFSDVIKNVQAFHQGFSSVEQTTPTILTGKPLTFTQYDKIEGATNEVETDELASFKKCLDLNKYFTSVYCVGTSVHYRSHTKSNLPLCEHFGYFSSNRRYIIFRVIRI